MHSLDARFILLTTLLGAACGGVSSNDTSGADAASIDGSSVDAPPDELTVSGPIQGTIPNGSVVVAIWSNTAGSPDTTHKHGEGTTSGATFSLTLPATLPNEAINLDELGVGVILVFPAGTVIADGKIEDDTIFDTAIGASAQSAVIFRNGGEAGISWETNFPTDSFSCGDCVPVVDGFDEFTPTQCTAVEVVAGDLASQNICNWT